MYCVDAKCSFRINTLRPQQNGHHFADSIFKCIFMKENVCILIDNLLKIVHEGPVDINSSLVYVVALNQTGGKPIPKPMLTKIHDAIWRH